MILIVKEVLMMLFRTSVFEIQLEKIEDIPQVVVNSNGACQIISEY